MIISDSEYKRLKAIEAAHLKAVDVESKWRALAVYPDHMHLELLDELRGALMNKEAAQPPPHLTGGDAEANAQHGAHLSGFTSAQKEEVRQMIQNALDTGSA